MPPIRYQRDFRDVEELTFWQIAPVFIEDIRTGVPELSVTPIFLPYVFEAFSHAFMQRQKNSLHGQIC